MKYLPLEGIRILDMTRWWSGPLCTSYFGAQGAEVIKVESVQSPDGFRFTMTTPKEDWWELSPQFNAANHNKLGITLNLNDKKGIQLLKNLAAKCDVIIENFTPRVMKNFGLSYETFREINPGIIMLSMPAYGNNGPYQNRPGFAYTFEILSGIAQTNGYRNEKPMIVSGVADVISGFHTAYAILGALEYKNRTGKGQFIEVAQVETCLSVVGQPIADFSMNGRKWGRMGNRHPHMAPHGVYRSKDSDYWLSLAIRNDEDWQSFREVIGNPEWANDERFRTTKGRLENQNELDKLVEEWTSQYDHHESAEILQSGGISAGPVLEVNEITKAPYLADMFQETTREFTGSHAYPSWPVKFSGKRVEHESPAPILGQHNEYVLKDILELSDEQISELENKQIIGARPLGVDVD